MRVSVLGLGYVGCVTAGCLAKMGHEVAGVDVNPAKVAILNAGKSPIVEAGVEELIAEMRAAGRLRATTDAAAAIGESEISLVCVGTPSNGNGSLDLANIRRVCTQIGSALQSQADDHTVVIRSTVLPGTVHSLVVPTLELHSGKKAGRGFGVCINPEFMREGTALHDFQEPTFTLIGVDDEEVAAKMRRLYTGIHAPILQTGIKTAEMVKYACNCFHALKVSFANEIGNLCKALGIDSHEVMELFCRDTKLNLSSAYLRPGFAFGGSCLPKDLRAITYRAKELDLEVPVLSSILLSNRLQIERAVEMVLHTRRKRVGVLGFSFKVGTDDLRESPMVTLIETLIGKGMQVAIYDRDVSLARARQGSEIRGQGARQGSGVRGEGPGPDSELTPDPWPLTPDPWFPPHISSLMRESIDEVLRSSEVLIIGNRGEAFRDIEAQLRGDQIVVDLVRLFDRVPTEWVAMNGRYQGICW